MFQQRKGEMEEEKQDRRSKVTVINDVANEVVLWCIRGRESYWVKEPKMEAWWHGGRNEVRWDVKEWISMNMCIYFLYTVSPLHLFFSHLSLKGIS
jgi:hypothetical protein